MTEFLLNDWLFWGIAVPVCAVLGMFVANAPLWAETWQMHKRHYGVAGWRAFLRFVAQVFWPSLHSVPAKSSEPNGNDVSAPGLAQGDNTGKKGVGK